MRSAYCCNIKICMQYFVIYGHWIEPMSEGTPFLEDQYRCIYLLHMPVFAYLSGLFLKSERDCARQVCRLIPLYALLQAAAVILSGGAVSPWTPWWHLWYLLSTCMWSGIAYIWFRFARGRHGRWWLAICVALVLLSGYAPWLGREMSGARTAAFLPFFWAGLISDPDREQCRNRITGWCALLVAGNAIALWGKYIPVEYLYHAQPYSSAGGVFMRLVCYILSGLLCFFIVVNMPDKRFPFTYLGADTLPVYLVHAPAVGLLRMFTEDWRICAVLSAALIWGLNGIFKWNGRMFGIAAGEGGRKRGRFSEGVRTAREGGSSLSSGPYTG